MQIERSHFRCNYCGADFLRRNPCGRKPHYCTRTCRQRSYEARRRQLHRPGLPVTDVVDPKPSSQRPPAYERGRTAERAHLLRPEGLPDRRRFRPTLCGVFAMPLPQTRAILKLRGCATCRAVSDRYPPDRHFDGAVDAGILRAKIARLREPGQDDERIIGELLSLCSPPSPARSSASPRSPARPSTGTSGR